MRELEHTTLQGPDYRKLQEKFQPSKLFPFNLDTGAHMDAIWAKLKAITEDLDHWDPKSQLSPQDFRSLCSSFLLDLVKDSVPSSSPDPIPSSPIASVEDNAGQEAAPRAELERMKVPALRKLAVELGIIGQSQLRRKKDLIEAIISAPSPLVANVITPAFAPSLPVANVITPASAPSPPVAVSKLEEMKGPALRKLAVQLGIIGQSQLRKKKDLINAILSLEEFNPNPVAVVNAPSQVALNDRSRLGFAPTIITPYMHASVAHLWEQRERLSAIGKFIGVPLTHKHISCSPGELSNNKYNRMYFQSSSRRLHGLEKEIVCTAWRAIINTVDIDRSKHECPFCTFKCVREMWMTRHIIKKHPQ